MDGMNRLRGIASDSGPTEILPAPDAIVSTSVEPADADSDQKPSKRDLTEVVIRAKERFKYIVAVETRSREAEKEDIRFVHVPGAQWNDGIRTQRMSEIPPRPVLEFDQTNQYIKRVTNAIRADRPGIKISPVGSGATIELARIRNGLVRQIEYQSCAEQAYDLGVEFAVTSGRGYWRVVSRYESEDSFFQTLEIRAIKSNAGVFLDPDYTTPDGSDRRYGFVCEYIDKDTFEAEWPGIQTIGWDSPGEDKYAAWWDGDKVCVCDYYEMVDVKDHLIQTPDGRGVWASEVPKDFPLMSVKSEERTRTRVDWYKLTDSPVPLAQYEWPGKFIPVIQCTGDSLMVDGERMYKGVVRRIRDPQMMFNYWFTAATERIALVAKAPYVSMAGQVENHPEWTTANIQNHHMLTYDPVELPDGTFFSAPPTRQQPPEPQDAMIQMCSLASDLMHAITGMQPPTLGEKTSPHQSGVALKGLREQSDIVTYNFPDNARLAIRLTGVIIDDLIPHYYSEDRVLQIVKPDGSPMSQRVNYHMPMGANFAPQKQMDLTIGKYSVTVDSGPSYETVRKEAATEFDDFLDMLGQAQAPMYADLRAKMADWPADIGEQVAARAFALLPPPVQQASLQADQDPALAPAKATLTSMQGQMQQQQQQFTQQFQGLQQQMGQLGQELAATKQKLAEAQLENANRSMEYANRSRELDIKQRDAITQDATTHRGDTLKYLSDERGDVIKLIDLMTKLTTSLQGATSGATQAAEGITNSSGALPPAAQGA